MTTTDDRYRVRSGYESFMPAGPVAGPASKTGEWRVGLVVALAREAAGRGGQSD
jgi:hypothetical protein